MKKLLIGAAAGALLAPLAAHAETTGFIDTAYEHTEFSNIGIIESWELGGAIQHDFASGWGVQGDFRSTNFDAGGSFTAGADYAAVHIYTSVSQNVDLAAFVGMVALPVGVAGGSLGARVGRVGGRAR